MVGARSGGAYFREIFRELILKASARLDVEAPKGGEVSFKPETFRTRGSHHFKNAPERVRFKPVVELLLLIGCQSAEGALCAQTNGRVGVVHTWSEVFLLFVVGAMALLEK